MRALLASTGARTDHDVSDDAAGIARARVASASKARKAAEAADLGRSNAALKAKLRATGAVVDDDISDDQAGQARDGYDLHPRGGWLGGFFNK